MDLLETKQRLGYPTILDEFLRPDWMHGMESYGPNVPAVNIIENENNFLVEMAVPGKKKEDFDLEVDDNVLIISSEDTSNFEDSSHDGKYTRKEFSYSAFKRSFTLPESVREEKIRANYENGVLSITLPKNEVNVTSSKKIRIS